MGQPKQLLVWQGESLVQRAVKTALATDCQLITLVLGAYANAIRLEIETWENSEPARLKIVENPDWRQGMSTSVKTGLQALLKLKPTIDAALVMLTDQPLLTPEHLLMLIDRMPDARSQMLEKSIVASFYNSKPSVPALFDKKWFGALQELSGDQGARALFQKYADEVLEIPFPGGAFDLDRPEDWELFISNS